MFVQPIELVGNEVTLIPMQELHIDGLFKAGKHDDIWPFMSMHIETKSDMERLVQSALKAQVQGKELPFVIIQNKSQSIVGSTRFLDISPENRSLEIGWTWLSPTVWRSSVNTECKYLLLNHCFETLHTIRVQIKTDARNVRSQKAIERIGGTQEGILRNHRILPDGYVRDSVYYSILDREWPQVKQRLLSLMQR